MYMKICCAAFAVSKALSFALVDGEDKNIHARMGTLSALFLNNVLMIGCLSMASRISMNLLSRLIVVTVQTSLLMVTTLRFGELDAPLSTTIRIPLRTISASSATFYSTRRMAFL